MIASFCAAAIAFPSAVADEGKSPNAQSVAAEIDRRLDEHWKANGITPAAPADDATWLRRLSLDLLGRIPARSEWEAYVADQSPPEAKARQAIQRMLDGPEFPLHFGAVLDEIVQGSAAGNAEFVDYLRRRVRGRESWDSIVRELLLGPWDSDETKPAGRFLDQRAKDLDRLTTDATRVFFGVDISCAKCHDHPLVDDWKQDHYFGMAAFFNRTAGGKGMVTEKPDGEVTFRAADGSQKTARMMFLSGRVVDEPQPAEGQPRPKFSRREQLVAAALEDKTFLSRAIVNRLWQHFFGRGLVHPVDQMHSQNQPSVPGLLDWLAADFVESGYDLQRLVAALVSSRAYRLSSAWDASTAVPDHGHFATYRVRLLSSRQYAMSLLVATGRAEFGPPTGVEARLEKYLGVAGLRRMEQWLAAEQTAAGFAGSLDSAGDGQSTTREALFVSNAPPVQELFRAEGDSLAARLAGMSSSQSIVDAAIRQVLSRPPAEDELEQLVAWLDSQTADRSRACEQLIWAIASSAEFRFHH